MVFQEITPPHDFLRGVSLFNRMAFFEAHEFMELAWRAEPGFRRQFYQGVLQLSVGWFHLQKQNLIGAQKVLTKAEQNLFPFPDHYLGYNLVVIRQQIKNLLLAISQVQEQEQVIIFNDWVDRYFEKIFPDVESSSSHGF